MIFTLPKLAVLYKFLLQFTTLNQALFVYLHEQYTQCVESNCVGIGIFLFPSLPYHKLFVLWAFVLCFLTSWAFLSLYITWNRRGWSRDTSIVILMILEEQKLLAFKQYFQLGIYGEQDALKHRHYIFLLSRKLPVSFLHCKVCVKLSIELQSVNYEALIISLKRLLSAI